MIPGSSQSAPAGGAAFVHLQGTEKQGWGQRNGSEEEKRGGGGGGEEGVDGEEKWRRG